MAIQSTQPTLDQLKRAVEIHQQISDLQTELASLLSGAPGSVIAKVKTAGARRGRPAGAKNIVSDLKAAAVAAPKEKKVAKKKRAMSEEGRKKIAEAQKKRWADKKAK